LPVPTFMRTASEFPDGPFPSQSILTIDLGAIADNYETLRTRAGRATCAAVVKADGYGLGITRVGAALSVAGCRDFFVAQLSEGSALRAALPPDARIYVLGGLFSGEETQYI